MDFMDIDQVFDVPDTPDRSAEKNIDGRGCLKKGSSSSEAKHLDKVLIFDERVTDPPKQTRHLVAGNGNNIRSHSVLPAINNISQNSDSSVSALGNSHSSWNANLFRRPVGEKAPNYENRHSIHLQHKGKGKALSTSQSSSCMKDKAIEDLTGQDGHVQMLEKPLQCGPLEKAPNYDNKHSIRLQHKGKGKALSTSQAWKALSTSQASSCLKDKAITDLTEPDGHVRMLEKAPFQCGALKKSLAEEANKSVFTNALKGKGKIVDPCKIGSGFDLGKGINHFGDFQPKSGKPMSASINSVNSPRVTGHKRLVRNGCISPHNIAKAKQVAEKHGNLSVDAVQDDTGTEAFSSPDNVDIRDLVAEENNFRVKGKGIMVHPFSSKDHRAKISNLPDRSSTIQNEKVNCPSDVSTDAFRCSEELGGWRSTRNPLKESAERDTSLVHQHYSRVLRKCNGNECTDAAGDGNAKYWDVSFCQQGASRRAVRTAPELRSQMATHNESHHVADTHIKRQKQRSTLGSHGESSSMGSDNSEILVLGSGGEPWASKSVKNQGRHDLSIPHPVIEIDEFSPETRPRASHNVGFSSNNDSARSRQLEADEMLARELQEQLYNEELAVQAGEIDAHIARALQHHEDSQHAFSGGSHNTFHTSGSLVSNLHRQSQSSHNRPTRRVTQARGPSSSRMARLRSRPPSRPRRILSGEPLFPSNMDVDMRIHILEALEDRSMQRDYFNENDYEMLLALDENNHHAGASVNQIDGLPESTVQNDNFEEACAICLDTPTRGDVIRHLPCLHKFHKDCIDPWLRRKTSCPVCKSSITP